MASPVVLCEVKDRIAYITMIRPDKRNTLNTELYVEAGKAWQLFEQKEVGYV